jgi:hypothetical protein
VGREEHLLRCILGFAAVAEKYGADSSDAAAVPRVQRLGSRASDLAVDRPCSRRAFESSGKGATRRGCSPCSPPSVYAPAFETDLSAHASEQVRERLTD